VVLEALADDLAASFLGRFGAENLRLQLVSRSGFARGFANLLIDRFSTVLGSSGDGQYADPPSYRRDAPACDQRPDEGRNGFAALRYEDGDPPNRAVTVPATLASPWNC
jgi:hypothetical protein